MKHIVVIGGGVIGLSIAYELAQRGQHVTILDTQSVGRKSSWAGAGIITPTNWGTAIHPLEKLESLSEKIHTDWSRQLFSLTRIDNEFWKCGGLYLARTHGEKAALAGQQAYWLEREIEAVPLTHQDLHRRFPSLKVDQNAKILFLPSEAQIRNPLHLSSLKSACERLGVQIFEHVNQLKLHQQGHCIAEVAFELGDGTGGGKQIRLLGDDYCITAGAWSGELLASLNITLPITPVRGQMALFKLEQALGLPIINEGSRYLVPRKDGHVLVGATVEEVGFDESTFCEDIDELVRWANSLVDDCHDHSQVSQWAGLRPASSDGFPYLGKVNQDGNVWVAAGHFKSGLHLSTGTAVVMADLIEGHIPQIDLSPFSPQRGKIYAKSEPL